LFLQQTLLISQSEIMVAFTYFITVIGITASIYASALPQAGSKLQTRSYGLQAPLVRREPVAPPTTFKSFMANLNQNMAISAATNGVVKNGKAAAAAAKLQARSYGRLQAPLVRREPVVTPPTTASIKTGFEQLGQKMQTQIKAVETGRKIKDTFARIKTTMDQGNAGKQTTQAGRRSIARRSAAKKSTNTQTALQTAVALGKAAALAAHGTGPN